MADRSVAIVVNVNYWSRKIGRCDDTARDLTESHIIGNSKLATTKRNPLIRGGMIRNDIAGSVY